MSNKSFIDSVKVGSPCSENWDEMQGNDKARFCSHCTKHVNNISEMTQKEATRMVRASDYNICIRYKVDPVTKRPIFAEQLFQITRRAPAFAAAGVMSATIGLSTAAYSQSPMPASTPVVVTNTQDPVKVDGGSTKIDDSITQQQIQELPRQSEMIMGGMMIAVQYTSPLTRAVADEDIDQVRDLIAKGADVNTTDKNYTKITPLFIAIENGDGEMVKVLLNAGAKINVRDSERQTPLMRLDFDATPELIDLLVSHRAKINLIDNEGNTAVIHAAGNVKSETLQALINAGADVRITNKEGRTALMNAAQNDDLESVRSLILAGSDINGKTEDGRSVWDQASDQAVKDLLESYGAIPSINVPEALEERDR